MVPFVSQLLERKQLRPGIFLLALATISPSALASASDLQARLDTVFAAQDWSAYEADLDASLADPATTTVDRAIVTVRLASFRHAIRQQGFAESVEQLPPALAILAAAAPRSPWLAEGRAQFAASLYRLQRLPEARDPALAGAALARELLADPDLDRPTRIRLYTAFNVLASIHMLSGEEPQARALFEEVITALEKLAPDHPQLGSAYVNYGLILYNFGRFRELADIMTKAGRIFADSANPVALAATRTNHGLALNQLGRYAEAEPLLADGVARFEAIGASRAPIFANAIQNWGIAAGYLGQTDAAVERINTALELRIALYGAEHFEVAVTLAHRARVHLQAGNLEAAVADSTRAAELTATLDNPDAQLDVELTILDVHLRCLAAQPRPTDTIAHFNTFEANLREVYERYTDRLEHYTRHQLAYGHEGERLGFLNRHDPFSAAVATGDARSIGQALLRYRGLVTDALIEDVQLGANADAADLTAWREALRSDHIDTATLADLETRLASHAAQLGASRRALTLTLPELRHHLRRGDQLLVFFVYQPWSEGPAAPAHYGAWKTTSGSGTSFINLGPCTELDDRVARFLSSLQSGQQDPAPDTLSAYLARRGISFTGEPINRVFIVPEGSLHQVPFAALTDHQNRFWAEQSAILHLGSPRDLIPADAPLPLGQPAVFTALGSPDFTDSPWSPLPAAATEVSALTIAAATAHWQTQAITGPDATEARLHDLGATTHLHLATHGFALATASDAEPAQRLAATGLILAHPRSDAWTDGRNTLPVDPTDGILTGLEIMPLDLRGVQLVTLAACTSAQGSNAPGEGLYGLPQAFRRAGAGSVVAALWPIEDDDARMWMTDFYARLFAGASIDAAFASTQATALRTLAEREGPAAAIRQAGGWILSYRAPHGD